MNVIYEQPLTEYCIDTRHKEQIEEKRRRLEENHRRGRHGEESSSDDEDEEDGETLKIEAPPVEEKKPALPVRPHPSHLQMPTPESERMRTSPSAAPA